MLLVTSLIFTYNSHATTYTVTNTNDTGLGSLNAAITSANSHLGADTVKFHLITSDINYSIAEGIWTIHITTALPYFIDNRTFIDGNSQSTFGTTNTNGPEVFIQCENASINAAFILGSSNNKISCLGITGFTYGILIYGSTSNTITDVYAGTNFDGTTSIPNQYGIGIANGASGNLITNCLLSGNSSVGYAISASNNNAITNCRIGTNRTATNKLPNNYGIAIDGGSNNTIGGSTAGTQNLISGNISGGIVINGITSTGNQIMGNLIGTNAAGTDTIPNANGIILAGANNSIIGGNTPLKRNVISGNLQAGIAFNGTGTRNNSIQGNFIGTTVTGNSHLSNHTGIMLKSKSNHNLIGGTTAADRNIISGNLEIGVYCEASDSNFVFGNFIGPDVSGTNTFLLGDSAIQGNGIELNTVSKYNTVGGSGTGERNIISGNRVYGLVYYGNSSYNNTSGNYIGTDMSGNNKLPNATGICVDGGSNHNIINNNVLSGNKSYGIFFVTTGTYYNVFKGNKVGTNATANDTIPNYIGVIVAAATKYNTIGGTAPGEANIITGNYYDGIEIADMGTDHNQIIGNQVGSINSLPGNYNGIGIATNPRNNIISNNTICKNKYMGIILFEQADSNQIINNYIGTTDGTTNLGNGGAGIAIVKGASYNLIKTNVIAYNDTVGVVLDDNNTLYNTISQNAIHHNRLIGIDIFPFGFNTNDAGDADVGTNLGMNSPVFTSTIFNPSDSQLWLNGTIDYNYISPAGIIIEIFKSVGDTLGYGQALQYLGSALVDASGHWFNAFTGATTGDKLVATATDTFGNTSEFSPNSSVVAGIANYSIANNHFNIFPNPAANQCYIEFNLAAQKHVSAHLYSIDGRMISSLFSESFTEGNHAKAIDTKSYPAGVYFISIQSDNDDKETMKLIITK
ncbi:MAG: right-handed parallel beta-helix repeat-containing protein [Bacteroidota bacterium]